MMQSKMVDDTDSREGKLALYRNTIKTQEEVRFMQQSELGGLTTQVNMHGDIIKTQEGGKRIRGSAAGWRRL